MNWEYLLDPQGGLPIFVVVSVLLFSAIVAIFRSIRIVPAQSALIVERLGKYAKTIEGGFHLLVPFIDRVRYTHNLKEQAIDVPTQPCFTHDNVKVDIDGVLYYRVMDPKRASYGITNYRMGTIQLAQTTMRSVIGQLDLDKTFEERENINASIMQGIDEATAPWGVKITRYEIQNIRVPQDILGAMEAQMKAERDKRAAVARSIGEMESRINYSLGEREEAVNKSEGEKQRLINEAEGQAEEIRALARATAAGIRSIADALEDEGAEAALVLQISEEYIRELKKLAKPETNVLLPMDLTNINAVLETVTRMVAENKEKL